MIKAKKHLGQHFLKDQEIAKKIAGSLELYGSAYARVMEIGPGMGVLTEYLLKMYGEDLQVVEIDEDMVSILQERFPELRSRIIHADFLKVAVDGLFDEKTGLIGNFPYNISSQILFRILRHREMIPEMAGMFQKEVALRITGREGNKDYGILSVLVQAFYETSYLFTVHEESFSPPPKVKSAVIHLVARKENPLKGSESFFVNVVKAAFNQRRKTLRNALKQYGDKRDGISDDILSRRAETLTVEEFIELASVLEKN